MTKTQRALAYLAAHPGATPYAAAKAAGLTVSAVYRAIAAREGREVCPTCGTLLPRAVEPAK